MAKKFSGIVTSIGMQDTVIVEVTRKTPHPLYRKLITRSKTFKADTKEVQANVGDHVVMVETRPMSKDKHFKIETVTHSKKVTKAVEKKEEVVK